MVKNIQGGSKHKAFARKHETSKATHKLRKIEDDAERYAIVIKLLGNGMFHCHGTDDILRLGHIRGKFSGRGKRDNMVEMGKWVLIGLREWDTTSGSGSASSSSSKKEKIPQCDLLEVYADADKHHLKETVVEPWDILERADVTKKATTALGGGDDVVVFGEREVERDRLIQEMKSATMEKMTLNLKPSSSKDKKEEEEVRVDDI